VSNRLSREKINYLSRQILTVLEKDDQVDFLDDPNEVRLVIVKSIEEEMRLYEAIDKKAIEKIQSQKKAIEEGSREWEILYRKYYNDELAKLGKLSDQTRLPFPFRSPRSRHPLSSELPTRSAPLRRPLTGPASRLASYPGLALAKRGCPSLPSVPAPPSHGLLRASLLRAHSSHRDVAFSYHIPNLNSEDSQ
jgi:hypothetical protein